MHEMIVHAGEEKRRGFRAAGGVLRRERVDRTLRTSSITRAASAEREALDILEPAHLRGRALDSRS
jgi:hypothetical protein